MRNFELIIYIIGLTFIGFSCTKDNPAPCVHHAVVKYLEDETCFPNWVFEVQSDEKNYLVYQMVNRCGTPPLAPNALDNFQFEAGKRVKISFNEIMDVEDSCFSGKLVEITCITEIKESDN